MSDEFQYMYGYMSSVNDYLWEQKQSFKDLCKNWNFRLMKLICVEVIRLGIA